ncbi:MAG: polysaccharide pyruvyl transferase family protein [Muribaculaceae bacterium]|nr:polysaccharide pyruvyl transferase family protein [Muribaculaceae bacterium]
MKYGILTFHRAHNYGAMLQAIALRAKLAENSNEVFFIDYWPKKHQEEYKIFNKDIFSKISFLGKLNYIRKYFRDRSAKKRRIAIFESFFDKYMLPFTTEGHDINFDAIFYGSDQIWRKRPEHGDDFDDVFFAKNDYHTRSHIAYAASMGVIFDGDDDLRYLKQAMTRFDHIGVRESDLKDLLEKAGVSEISLNIDPTFLLDKHKWTEILDLRINNKERYILFYDLMYGSFDLNAVKEFAKAKGLKLKVLKGRIDREKYDVETISDAGPREFVELIANAEYVFTSSFHGLAFSLIFGKQFYASYQRNSARAATILGSLGLSDRLLPPLSPSIPAMKRIDYAEIDQKMGKLRRSSEDYLKMAVREL